MHKVKLLLPDLKQKQRRCEFHVPFSRSQVRLTLSVRAFRKDSSDSGVDGAMGNNSSGPTPAVFYSPQYGVALGRGARSPREQEQVDSVRLRRMGTAQKPVRGLGVDRDGRSPKSPNLASPQSERNVRESFYSTAESGFETLPEVTEEEADSAEELSLSLKENFSVSSLKERNDRYFASHYGERAGGSSAGVAADPSRDQGEVRGDVSVPTVFTEPATSSEKSSPQHSGDRMADAHLLSIGKRGGQYSHSEDYEEDPSLEVSESLRSFNSSGEEWSVEEEDRDPSPLQASQLAMTDSQFRQSLMQRIRDWSTFAEDYGKSPSPMPETAPLHARRMCRSHSLDHHLAEAVTVPEVEMSSVETPSGQDTTIRSLENLETQFHDIQGEFESITSKLHELIEKGTSQEESAQKSVTRSSPSHRNHPLQRSSHGARSQNHGGVFHQRPRTKWERMPSTAHSDSSRSSRASSVDFSWDCGEVGGLLGREGGGSTAEGAMGDAPDVAGRRDDGDTAEGVSEGNGDQLTSIGKAVSIEEYAAQEWKGDTPKAHAIRQGYLAVPQLFHCQHLRQVRGDNYCALRSTLFQVLVEGHRVTQRWPGLISIVERLHELNADSGSGLQRWTFAGRLRWQGEEERFSIIAQCVLSLYVMIEEISALPSAEERLSRTLSLLNGSQRFDTELMEGLKLMMLIGANDLRREMREEAAVPTFAWLLFARDTSPDVVAFVDNHLNCVGDSAGIDQVEMCLLGHCLGVRLCVARLQQHGQEDFHSCFPDEDTQDWPRVSLLAEDDRHYNVPVA